MQQCSVFGPCFARIQNVVWLVDRNIEFQRFAQGELHQEEAFFLMKVALSETLKFNVPVDQSCPPIMSMFNQFSTGSDKTL